ncbi:hypothetical protein DICPUDRAFT_76684 [Dictyostelium purpureum]|uniref:Spastin n=1 Tax=Dictyostelium purpureum TaxID=5786 RepID=F0ZEB6_DICPU|nr:uncharacterized protein DICPUDRAFT_76684 [Dictyostelium purpureum]EGC37742.1 hypothetical protein DICPUDRAFT_76684 [Dictyostelium purpureum]|eukprot:XP_003285763.1 hypothetical protein DICPUDRAFT_76684 [Dictyostelium purpureum]
MLGHLVQLFFEDKFEDEYSYNRYLPLEEEPYVDNQVKVSLFNFFFIFTFIFLIVDIIISCYQHKENIRQREIHLSSKLNKIINDFENQNHQKQSQISPSPSTSLSPSPSISSTISSPVNKRSISVPNLISQAKNELLLKESKEQIEKAKKYDQSLDYQKSLELYIEGIGKLMSINSSFKDSKEFKNYIDFYLKRAEYIKQELSKNTNEKLIINFEKFQKEHQQQQQQVQQQQRKSGMFSLFSKPSATLSTTTNKSLGLSTTETTNRVPLTKSSSQTLISNPPSSTNVNRRSVNLSPKSNNTNNNVINLNNIPEIKGVDKAMISIIMNEILDRKNPVTWNDVVGLDKVKQSLMESVILPNLRPDVFTGLRAPPRGLLLFGPPGTGKSMIAKAVAYESKVTFFSISASSLTSKYVGDGEKLARALFAVATHFQPSIIFIDEIDSLLTERSSNESEASRRLKTEILLQFDGVRTSGSERVLVMGATNRPEDLDDAALRRLVKRIYVCLPEYETRLQIIQHLLKDQRHSLSDAQLGELANLTNGYSGFDLTSLCKDAAYEPIRRLGTDIKDLDLNKISLISFKDFRSSLKQIRPSVSAQSLKSYEKWNSKYGLI